MYFEWDEVKNRSNIRKHGFDFADAVEMFHGALLVRPDTSEDYGEERWRRIGTIRGRTAVVIFTEPTLGTIRVISLRRGHNEKREEYEKAIQDGLETG